MKKIGVCYGSSTGTCEELAHRIASKLGVAPADVRGADKLTAEWAEGYDALLLGTSTWGDGEPQDDWYDALDTLRGANLSGKAVALFGCGDAESYPDTFCDGMAALYEGLKDSGCSFVGDHVSPDGYAFAASRAVVDGAFVGLALDEVNESDKTDARIDAWVSELKARL